MNEIFTIIGWVGAVLATLYLTPAFREFGRGFFDSEVIADMVTAGVIFTVTLSLFTAVSYFGSKSLRESNLNAVDRSLGFGFGILRSLILIALAYIMVCYIWKVDKRPEWVMEAKTRPVFESAAVMVKNLLPGDLDIIIREEDKPTALDRVMNGEKEKKDLPKKEDQTGYSGEARDAIGDFFNR